jgi:exfoliative toxin A/B
MKPFIGAGALCLWYGAVIVHLSIMLLFAKRFIFDFKTANVFPSWFIAFVGIVTISVTAPAMDVPALGQIAFCVGLTLYFVALPLIVYRMSKAKSILEPLRLTTAIFTAPISLCLVGYLASFKQPNELLVYSMFAIALISYIYVTARMMSLIKIRFYPTYAAFTFPYVISAIAFRLTNAFLVERGIAVFAPLATISLWLAVAMVIYVIGHYVRYFRFWLKF